MALFNGSGTDFAVLSDSETYRRSRFHTNAGSAQMAFVGGATSPVVIGSFDAATFYSDAALVFDRHGLVPETSYLVDVQAFEPGRAGCQNRFLDDEACYCVGYNNSAANYYHWMMQCLPAIYSYTLADPAWRTVVLVPPYQGFQRESLELAGLDFEVFHVEPHTCYNVPKIMICNYLHGAMAYSPSPFSMPLFGRMRDAALERHKSDRRAERIYVSRSDSPNRPLANEDALMSSLSRLGFEILISSQLSLCEQISAFASAEVIVAPHGAGLSNIVFCKPGCRIYELTPDHYVNSCFLNLAQTKGNEYWLESYPSVSEGSSHERAWIVDVGAVEKTVESILKGTG